MASLLSINLANLASFSAFPSALNTMTIKSKNVLFFVLRIHLPSLNFIVYQNFLVSIVRDSGLVHKPEA